MNDSNLELLISKARRLQSMWYGRYTALQIKFNTLDVNILCAVTQSVQGIT
jgi:hypothetical protein